MSEKDALQSLLKRKDILVIVVCVGAFLVLTNNVHKTQMGKFNQLKQDIEIEKQKGESLERIVIAHEKIKKLKERSWESVDTNQIIEKVFNIGLGAGVKIRDINPQQKEESDHIVRIPFSINCEATYENCMLFLKNLEEYPKLIHIRSVSINPFVKEGDEEMSMTVSIFLEALYFK